MPRERSHEEMKKTAEEFTIRVKMTHPDGRETYGSIGKDRLDAFREKMATKNVTVEPTK